MMVADRVRGRADERDGGEVKGAGGGRVEKIM